LPHTAHAHTRASRGLHTHHYHTPAVAYRAGTPCLPHHSPRILPPHLGHWPRPLYASHTACPPHACPHLLQYTFSVPALPHSPTPTLPSLLDRLHTLSGLTGQALFVAPCVYSPYQNEQNNSASTPPPSAAHPVLVATWFAACPLVYHAAFYTVTPYARCRTRVLPPPHLRQQRTFTRYARTFAS